MVIEVREEQPSKAHSPILVTEAGMVIEVREKQPEKALSPILVTEAGMVIEVRAEQPEKAESPILVTEEGITTSFALPLYLINTPFSICESRIKSSS